VIKLLSLSVIIYKGYSSKVLFCNKSLHKDFLCVVEG